MERVLVVGGSEDFPGAAYLAGISALRSGAGSVIVMAPERAAWAINALTPDLMTRKLKGKFLGLSHEAAIMRQLKTADILLIGNGAGLNPKTALLMRKLAAWRGKKVIDADALKALRGNIVSNGILTPNENEWRMLSRQNDIKKLLSQDNVIVRKGFPAEVISAKKSWKMPATNRGLARAGTGDVLAGLCAGYLAQGLTPFEAAKEAAKTGNRIADILTRKKKGYYFLASDIADQISRLRQKRVTL